MTSGNSGYTDYYNPADRWRVGQVVTIIAKRDKGVNYNDLEDWMLGKTVTISQLGSGRMSTGHDYGPQVRFDEIPEDRVTTYEPPLFWWVVPSAIDDHPVKSSHSVW